MRERPILMSAPMVLACRREVDPKTQTRRGVKGAPPCASGCYRRPDGLWIWVNGERPDNGPGPGVGMSEAFPCPYGVPGDRLWVREAWRTLHKWDTLAPRNLADDISKITYEADPENRNPLWAFGKLRPSMFMPRWASRLTLEITEVRVERLNACSEADARAEGLIRQHHVWRDCEYPLPDVAYLPWEGAPHRYSCPVEAYRALWEHINGPGSWAANPWVWAVSFKRMEA